LDQGSKVPKQDGEWMQGRAHDLPELNLYAC